MKTITEAGDTPIDGIVDIGKPLCITMNIDGGAFSAVALMDDGSRLKVAELNEGQNILLCPSGHMVVSASGEASAVFDVTSPRPGFNVAPGGVPSGGGVTYGDGLAVSDNAVSVDWSQLPAVVFRTDQTTVVTGNTSFTQPLGVADGTSSGHAINRGQAFPVSTLDAIVDGMGLLGVQTWRIDEDYMYSSMKAPAELLYFARGRDYVVNVAGPSFNVEVPASRLVLRCSSMSTMVNPYVLPSVMIVPFQSNYYNRNAWQVGISLNAAPVTTTPTDLDGYPFTDNWTDGSNPTRFWCDIQLPFATLTPRIRVMATPAGSEAGTAPVLDTRGLSLPSLVKPCAFLVAIASGRASILMLNHDAKLYRLYDFASGIALSAEPTLYLSAYTYKNNTENWAQTWHQIGAPRISYNAKLAAELIGMSTQAYAAQ